MGLINLSVVEKYSAKCQTLPILYSVPTLRQILRVGRAFQHSMCGWCFGSSEFEALGRERGSPDVKVI
jgi:hypothetical protein